jgi:hypothetical protein
MTETILPTKALPEILFARIRTENVRMVEDNGVIQLEPVREKKKYEVELCGILADCPELSSYRYAEEKQFEKELEE